MYSQLNVLKDQLPKAKTTEVKLTLLQEMGWYHAFHEAAEALDTILDTTRDILAENETLAPHYATHNDLLIAYQCFITNNSRDALTFALDIHNHHIETLRGAWQWRIYVLLGSINSYIGNSSEAIAMNQQAYGIATEQDDPIGQFCALNDIAFVYFFMHDYDKSLDYNQQAHAIIDSMRETSMLWLSYINLSNGQLQHDNLEEAKFWAQAALAIVNEDGDKRQWGYARARYANVMISRGQYAEAETHLRETIAAMPDMSSLWMPRMMLYRRLATALIEQGKAAEAIPLLTTIIEGSRAKGYHVNTIYTLEALVDAYEALGDYQQALAAHRQHFEVYRQFQDQENRTKIQLLDALHRTREAERELAHQKQITVDAMRRIRQTRQYFEELNAMKTEFIASATHDLKNPLTSINNKVYLLRRQIDPSLHRHLKSIERNAGRMNNLITDMLDVAKLETGDALKLSHNNLTLLITLLVAEEREQAAENSQTIVTQLPDETVRFYFDQDYIHRGLLNLVTNAIKYAGDGTTIRIRLKRDGDWVQIEVADDGVGIPADDLAHLFDRFYRVQHPSSHEVEGTGLGLSILKTIIEQPGGTIAVTSQLGTGTTFRVRLPYRQSLET